MQKKLVGWDTKNDRKIDITFELFWSLKKGIKVRGSPGLVNLWEARVEAVLLLWPTVFPNVLHIECRQEVHTVGQKYPEID